MKTLNKENSQNNGKQGKFSKGKFSKGKESNDGIKFIANRTKKVAVDDNRKNLRRIYNQLMQKDQKKKRPVNKVDLVKKVMKSVDNNYSELCFKPDGSRILQACIKYGDKTQKREIIKQLKSHLYELVVKKYSIYLAIKIFKYCDNKQKEELIAESILPNLGKFLKNGNGQLFLNYVFDNVLAKQQNLICEHYINKVLKISLKDIQNLNDENPAKNTTEYVNENPSDPSNDIIIIEKQGTYTQDNIKEKIKTHIEKQLEKGIHKVFCFQAFLNKIFDNLDPKTKAYISEVFDDDVNELLTNKSGVELACKIFTVASVKTRKKMIKKIKESVKSYLSNENIIIFLIKIILFNDDTKLVEKHIINTLLESLSDEFLSNKSILKIFSNILNYRNNKVNTQQENKIISYDINSSSKKDEMKRQEEIMQIILVDLFKVVDLNIKFCLTDQYYSIILNDLVEYLIKSNNQEKLSKILNDIINVLEIDYKNNFDDFNNVILADKTGHFTINRILKAFEAQEKNDKEKSCDNEKIVFEFSKKLAKILSNNIEGFLDTKAIFIIIHILENEKTKSLIEKDLLKHKLMIKNKENEAGFKGFQIISKNLFKN